MSNRNKQRGSELERELVNIAKDFGLPAERAYASNGKALGEAEDVDCKVGKDRVQCKRRKTLPAYLQIPDSCDAVYFRQDRGAKLVLINLEYYLELLGGRRPCRTGYESAEQPSVQSAKAIAGVPTPQTVTSSIACESSQSTPAKKVDGSTSTSPWTATELPPPPSLL